MAKAEEAVAVLVMVVVEERVNAGAAEMVQEEVD